MKKIGTICIVSVMSILLTGCCLSHDWQEATCTTPKTCAKCGEIKGEALGHDWQEATCTEAKTCSVCGETEGTALGHKWQEATCTEAKTCSVCGETEGEALGHEWQEANCLSPKTCRVCGETEGDIGDHAWVEATCLAPKTCTVCGETEGDITSHNYNENGICTMCGASRELLLTMNNVNDFLMVTYTVESGKWYYVDSNRRRTEENEAKIYYDYGKGNIKWYTVTVSPISNDYLFQNVQISIGVDSKFNGKESHYDGIYGDMDKTCKEHKVLYGIGYPEIYSLSNEGTLIIEFGIQTKISSGPNTYYTQLENIMITDVSGTCIRK